MASESKLPDWAMRYAEAASNLGETIPEIEEKLVAMGLAKGTATVVAIRLQERRKREEDQSRLIDTRRNWFHRILAVLVGGLCILILHGLFDPYLDASKSLRKKTVGGVSVLVCIIWLPVGKGKWEGKSIAPLPLAFVRWVAWFLLALVFIAIVCLGIG